MIYVFSGTGNSSYAAKLISDCIGDRIVSLNEMIKRGEDAVIPEERLIFVVPTYAWRIPRVISNWIEGAEFHAGQKAYFVMTCGGDIGAADRHLRKLCSKKNLEYMGCLETVMPENYIAMFDVPSEEEAKRSLERADKFIGNASGFIVSDQPFPERKTGVLDRVKSGVVNSLFYRFMVSAKKFRVNERCIGCGLCAQGCPLNNIAVTDGKPLWGNHCTHCMACICRCPEEAIEYGKTSVGKRRYVCPGE